MRHGAALLGALETRLCTGLAVVSLVLGTLIAAGLADLRTQRADGSRMLAAARYGISRQAADRSAIRVQCDGARHHLHILFVKPPPWMLGALGTEFPSELTGNSASNGFVVTFMPRLSGGEEFAKFCLEICTEAMPNRRDWSSICSFRNARRHPSIPPFGITETSSCRHRRGSPHPWGPKSRAQAKRAARNSRGSQPLRNLQQWLDAGPKAAHGGMVLLQLAVGQIPDSQL